MSIRDSKPWKLDVLCNESPRVQNKVRDLTWNDGHVIFKLPLSAKYKIRPDAFEYHHCVKGGVDHFKIGKRGAWYIKA